MKTLFKSIVLFILTFTQLNGQRTIESAMCLNPDFNKKVNSYLNYSVPTISVKQLAEVQNDVVILDARELEEFETSHIGDARRIGYKKLDKSQLESIDTDQTIVVYCSIGYRSEKVGEKLKEMGYSQVFNLYGSIFEWVNQGNPVFDTEGNQTNKVHTYNRKWSKWVDTELVDKVY